MENTHTSIDAFIAAVKQHAAAELIDYQCTTSLADKGRDAVSDFMERCYIFPLDQAYVDQSKMAGIVYSICAAYERPDLSAWMQLLLYIAWRQAFLVHPWMIYENTKYPEESRLHIACSHKETCEQVTGYAYSSCTAQVGDALRLSHMEKPVAATPSAQIMLDQLWQELVANDELPQSDMSMTAPLDKVIELVNQHIKSGVRPNVDAGLANLSATITELAKHKYLGNEIWKKFRPEDALLVICHSILLEAIR